MDDYEPEEYHYGEYVRPVMKRDQISKWMVSYSYNGFIPNIRYKITHLNCIFCLVDKNKIPAIKCEVHQNELFNTYFWTTEESFWMLAQLRFYTSRDFRNEIRFQRILEFPCFDKLNRKYFIKDSISLLICLGCGNMKIKYKSRECKVMKSNICYYIRLYIRIKPQDNYDEMTEKGTDLIEIVPIKVTPSFMVHKVIKTRNECILYMPLLIENELYLIVRPEEIRDERLKALMKVWNEGPSSEKSPPKPDEEFKGYFPTYDSNPKVKKYEYGYHTINHAPYTPDIGLDRYPLTDEEYHEALEAKQNQDLLLGYNKYYPVRRIEPKWRR